MSDLFRTALADLISRKRGEQEMSLEALSAVAKVSIRSIQRIERGKTGRPHNTTLARLGTALGCLGDIHLLQRSAALPEGVDQKAALAEAEALVTDVVKALNSPEHRKVAAKFFDVTEMAYAMQDALDRNLSRADAIFERIEEHHEEQVLAAADAAYHRGMIAAAELRWHDAAELFVKSARLNPTFPSLYKAREFMWRLDCGREAIEYGERLVSWSEANEGLSEKAEAKNEHALTLMSLQRYEEAEALMLEVLRLNEAEGKVNHWHYAVHLHNLAKIYLLLDRNENALQLFQQSLKVSAQNPSDDPEMVLHHMTGLAIAQHKVGQSRAARRTFEDAAHKWREGGRTSHPNFAMQLYHCAITLISLGEEAEAEQALREALEIQSRVLGAQHRSTRDTAEALSRLNRRGRAQ